MKESRVLIVYNTTCYMYVYIHDCTHHLPAGRSSSSYISVTTKRSLTPGDLSQTAGIVYCNKVILFIVYCEMSQVVLYTVIHFIIPVAQLHFTCTIHV